MRKTAIVRWALLMLLPASFVCADDIQVKQELKRLRGAWRLEWVEVDGKRQQIDASAQPVVLRFDEQHLQVGDQKFPFTIDPTTDPKLIDIRVQQDNTEPRTFEGIYRLAGDELLLCVYLGEGVPVRPEAFQSQEGSQRIVVRLTRDPAADPSP